MFDHQWLTAVQRAPGSADVWDVEPDGYADAESGHGTFIAGLILQVAPAAEVYVVKVLDSHGVGDDADRRRWRWSSCRRTSTSSTSRSAATPTTTRRRSRSPARCNAMRKQRNVVVAAAGNDGERPAVLARGVQAGARGRRRRAEGQPAGARPTSATSAGGSTRPRAASTCIDVLARARRKVAQGAKPDPTDPSITFDGWAAWDGTSFASPITAGGAGAHDVAQRARERRGRAGAPALDLTARAAAGLPARGAGRRDCCRSLRSSSRGSRSARRAARRAAARRPARRPSSMKRPSSSACTAEAVLARALDGHRRRRGRQQLALEPALARAGRGHLELDPEPRRLEAQLPRAVPAAHERTSLLLRPRRCRASARRAPRPRCAR